MDHKLISITISGKPFGKQRPLFVRRGRFSKATTPIKTVNYEVLVKEMYHIQCNGETIEGPIRAEIKAYMQIPKSTSNKKRELMLSNELLPEKKPDVDNIAKIILDALNGIAYHDDSSVVSLTVEKYYSDKPRVEVVLESLHL